MGIKSNFREFLRKNYPTIFKTESLNIYSGKKIAIDISLYINKYKAKFGDQWLGFFIRMILSLRKNAIECVFIYDSSSPPEKIPELEKRKENRRLIRAKISNLKTCIQTFQEKKELSQALIVQYQKLNRNGELPFDIRLIQNYVERIEKNIYTITPQDMAYTVELLTILNIPFYMAPMEAETICADLCIRGLVDGVLSDDTDLLAYGCPVFLTKLNLQNNTIEKIEYNHLLTEAEMTHEQFLDFCILCGTDYNKNLPGIGAIRGYNLIKLYNRIENLPKEHNIEILNHIRCRELFRNFDRLNIGEIPICGTPNIEKLSEFLNKNIPANEHQKIICGFSS